MLCFLRSPAPLVCDRLCVVACGSVMDRFLAAVVQMASGPRRETNLERAAALVREAARRGASLVVLPEVFAWRGPRSEEAAHAETIPGPSTDAMAEVARATGVHLLMGSILEQAGGEQRTFNTTLPPVPERGAARTVPEDPPLRRRPARARDRARVRRPRAGRRGRRRADPARRARAVDLLRPALSGALPAAGEGRRGGAAGPVGVHVHHGHQRTGRCSAARARSRTSATCWRPTRRAPARTASPTSGTR